MLKDFLEVITKPLSGIKSCIIIFSRTLLLSQFTIYIVCCTIILLSMTERTMCYPTDERLGTCTSCLKLGVPNTLHMA